MHVELVPARVDDKPVITNLMQLYLYDFSLFMGWSVNEDGLFQYPDISHYWTDPDRHAFLLRVDGMLAGFALVDTLDADGEPVHELAEFFVLPRFRRKGVGEGAARSLFDRWPGSWSVAELDENVMAQRFWRKVIHRYTGGAFTERHDDEDGLTVQEFNTGRAR